jgi:hypothetical protein
MTRATLTSATAAPRRAQAAPGSFVIDREMASRPPTTRTMARKMPV